MWIDRATVEKLRTELEVERAKRELLQQQTIAANTMMDWFRVRLTQLEFERAQLIFNYTGVKVPTPVIDKADPPHDGHPFNEMSALFQGLDDKEASRLGISWAPDGTVNYTKQ